MEEQELVDVDQVAQRLSVDPSLLAELEDRVTPHVVVWRGEVRTPLWRWTDLLDLGG